MRLATFLVALLLGFMLPRAEAHEMTMAEMEVREATNPEETVRRQSQLGQVFNKRKAATT